MGVELLRGGAARSPFLVATFALLSLILLFNWWALSTENLDLLKEIEGLSQHLKSSSSLLDQCRTDRAALENRVKSLEDDTEKLVQKVDAEQKRIVGLESNVKESNRAVVDAGKKIEDANDKFKNCDIELVSLKKVVESKDGLIKVKSVENTNLGKQVQELNEQIATLNTQIKQLKSEQHSLKKGTSSTEPQKVENEVDNEVRNLPEPYRADEKEAQHKGDHIAEKDDQIDERELEMQGNADDRKV